MRFPILRSVSMLTGLAFVALAPTAHAQNTPLPAGPFTMGGGLWQWDSFSHGGDFDSFNTLSSFVLDEARINGRLDAYDGAHEFLVFDPDSSQLLGYDVPSERVDVFGNAATGFRLEAPVTPFLGLNFSESYFLFPNAPIARVLYRIENPTGAPISVNVRWHHNLGSDAATRIETTQDGDTILEQTDRTLITSDGNPAGDAVLGWVRYGENAPLFPSAIEIPGGGNDSFEDAYALTIAPGETNYLLFYGVLGETVAGVSTTLQPFSSNDAMFAAGLLNGLDNATLVRIRNYNLTAAPLSAAPEPGALALIASGTLPLLAIRRRKVRLSTVSPVNPY